MRNGIKSNKKKSGYGKFIIYILLALIVGVLVCIFINKKKVANGSGDVTKTVEDSPVLQEEKAEVVKVVEEKNFISKDKEVFKKSGKNIKIPVLIYHAFAKEMPAEDKYNLFVTTDKFEEQITTLLNDEYTFITFEELQKYNNESIGLPEKVVLITIDDGWVGNFSEVFPLLKKYDIPATIFVVNELLGTPGYFTWEQAKEMFDSKLVKIHSHGKKHIDYTTVSIERVKNDISASHGEIEEKLGKQMPKYFAYPAGKYTADTVNALKSVGFNVQVLTKYGTVNKSSNLDLTNIGRIRCEQSTSGTKILNIIRNAKLV